VPSVFIETMDDQVIPTAVQEAMAALAGSELVTLEGAGHMAQLSRTAEIADIIDKEAKKLASSI
jgi:pimeloyl-ACP methyl ester carboxylesterase